MVCTFEQYDALKNTSPIGTKNSLTPTAPKSTPLSYNAPQPKYMFFLNCLMNTF